MCIGNCDSYDLSPSFDTDRAQSSLLYVPTKKFNSAQVHLVATNNSKINNNPKCVYLPISKLYSILAVENLHVHNNLWFRYYGQVNSLRLKSSVATKWASKHLWGTFNFADVGT